jgi:hypothetical protein
MRSAPASRRLKNTGFRAVDKVAERKAAVGYGREERRRQREREKEESARRKDRERRQAVEGASRFGQGRTRVVERRGHSGYGAVETG